MKFIRGSYGTVQNTTKTVVFWMLKISLKQKVIDEVRLSCVIVDAGPGCVAVAVDTYTTTPIWQQLKLGPIQLLQLAFCQGATGNMPIRKAIGSGHCGHIDVFLNNSNNSSVLCLRMFAGGYRWQPGARFHQSIANGFHYVEPSCKLLYSYRTNFHLVHWCMCR